MKKKVASKIVKTRQYILIYVVIIRRAALRITM